MQIKLSSLPLDLQQQIRSASSPDFIQNKIDGAFRTYIAKIPQVLSAHKDAEKWLTDKESIHESTAESIKLLKSIELALLNDNPAQLQQKLKTLAIQLDVVIESAAFAIHKQRNPG